MTREAPTFGSEMAKWNHVTSCSTPRQHTQQKGKLAFRELVLQYQQLHPEPTDWACTRTLNCTAHPVFTLWETVPRTCPGLAFTSLGSPGMPLTCNRAWAPKVLELHHGAAPRRNSHGDIYSLYLQKPKDGKTQLASKQWMDNVPYLQWNALQAQRETNASYSSDQ